MEITIFPSQGDGSTGNPVDINLFPNISNQETSAKNGQDGKSITIISSSFDGDGNTIVYFSDGSNITVNKGDTGSSPAYEWLGTSIRFMNPDGSWGSYVDLKGAKGDKGDKGDNGDSITIVGSTIDGDGNTVIQFSDGSFVTVDKGNTGDPCTILSWYFDGANTIINFSDGTTVTIPSAGGYWSASGDDIINNNIAGVGIGVASVTSGYLFEVGGDSKIDGNLLVTGNFQFSGTISGGTYPLINIPTTSSSSIGVIQQNSLPLFSTYGTSNLFFGKNAGNFTFTTGSAINNIGVGESSLFSLITSTNNIAIGKESLNGITGGGSNIAIGTSTLTVLINGSNNIAIGHHSSINLANAASRNTSIGASTLNATTSGNDNTVIGYLALQTNTTGSNNVAIGSISAGAITTGTNNVIIGYSAATSLTTGSGNILIGGNVINFNSTTASNQLNIGNAIWGTAIDGINTTVSSGNIGFFIKAPTARVHLPAGTATAGTAPFKFTSGINLTSVEAGAMEWDGSLLYITQTSGPTRKTIAYTTDLSSYLPLAGGTMLGNLILNADATNVLQAVTLQQLNAAVVGLFDLRGGYNASVNTYPTTGGSGTAGAVLKGDVWIITTGGSLGGTAVVAGDQIIALVDTPAQTAANWNIQSHDLGYTPLNQTLNNTQIFVGNSSNVATGVALSLNASSGAFGLSNTGVLTMLDASTTNRGLLNSTDWNTFNNKVSSPWITNSHYITYTDSNAGFVTAQVINSSNSSSAYAQYELINDIVGNAGLTFYSSTASTGGTIAANALNLYNASGVINIAVGTGKTIGMYVNNVPVLISPPDGGSNGYILSTNGSGITSWIPNSTGTVTSVSGTSNRITSTGGATPVIDISAFYGGQSSITTLGTITTGVWNGTAIANTNLANSVINWAIVGNSGTAPAFSVGSTALGATATLNIPLASATSVTAGLISKTQYDSFNGKVSSQWTTDTNGITYSGNVGIGVASAAGVKLNISYNRTSVDAGFQLVEQTGLGFNVIAETFNFNPGVNATSTAYINFSGYNSGTTQFRNLFIGDGKAGTFVYFDGENHILQLGNTGSFGGALKFLGLSSSNANLTINGASTIFQFDKNVSVGGNLILSQMEYTTTNGGTYTLADNKSGLIFNGTAGLLVTMNPNPVDGEVRVFKGNGTQLLAITGNSGQTVVGTVSALVGALAVYKASILTWFVS